MQSKAADVDSYLAEAPAERRAPLAKLRGLCRQVLEGYDEGMRYGMAVYTRDGVPEVAFASQKGYVALYIMKTEVVEANRALLKGLSVGKSCVRYPDPDKIDFVAVKVLLRGTVRSQGKAC